MSIEEVLIYLNADRVAYMTPEMHACSLAQSQNAIRQTMALNTRYHRPEEIVAIMSDLTGEKVDESLMLFPPFYTDFGRNIHLGKHVFIHRFSVQADYIHLFWLSGGTDISAG